MEQQQTILQLQRQSEERFADLQAYVSSLFDRTRLAVGVQAEATREAVTHALELSRVMAAKQAAATSAYLAEQSELTRAAVGEQNAYLAEQSELTRAAVAEQSELTRAAVAEQSELTRAAVGEQSDLTRATLIGVIQGHLDSLKLDAWRLQEFEGLLRYTRRRDYLEAIRAGTLERPRLETQHPIAVSSNDTIYPRGCKNDNSICLRFNRKLNSWFDGSPRLKILDLGCAGGGMVRSFLDEGHFAVGLEGSDFPLTNQLAEWSTIPYHLFTCDITQPFQLMEDKSGDPLYFDVITAWEVMEHIPEGLIPGLLANIDRHLAPGGKLIFSIATFLDWDSATGIKWHVTVKPEEWWIDRFQEAGFCVDREHPFKKGDYIRGSGNCRGDWTEDSNTGFHLVLHRQQKPWISVQAGSAA